MKKGFLNSSARKPGGAAATVVADTVQSTTSLSTPKAVETIPSRPSSSAASNGPPSESPTAQLPPTSQPLHLQPLPNEATTKVPPFSSSSSSSNASSPPPPPFKYAYSPSPTGIDSNLLILLHGLGDHLTPFSNLGKRLQGTLPQTAVLALQGAHPIPWLSFPGDEQEGEEAGQKHWCYWEAISPLGETLPFARQELGKFLKGFEEVMQEVVGRCGWPAGAVHLLGFGQGATAALEGAVHWARKERNRGGEGRLGSIVAICGGMLSLPTFTPPLPIPTLYFHRPSKLSTKSSSNPLNHMRRAFQNVTDLPFPTSASSSRSGMQGGADEEGEEERMPSSQKEWDGIVHWWSEGGRWRNRGQWELQATNERSDQEGGVFRVT
ncbi:hypothetical protein BCV69DRAFT_194694 [Microstroma glucosiphilum]|uniref:Phospholipase/carboxylesterase/thioesterase domain-containing protein n=1 Tax=Pseudomicrostroma glucosiphilum TaxID=1684307 RepID=A0A316U716_9BASI|nr:hypothetical protein BCV69DRAFT_194694 [Pseudomicrostroma glucosiphilum]PWN20634.1 hypothetical protein BCV69DRAFT_194694 [Pseudomicrostroma glucosiphilum]